MTAAEKDKVVDFDVPLDFNVKRIEPVTLGGPAALMGRDLMSPYVWREADGRWGIMVRAVTKAGEPMVDTGQIWAGWSEDGVNFAMLDAPSIVPGPGDHDAGGVEDPTVIRRDDGYVVYYSGVLADHAHGELSYATGPSLDRLVKSGVALASSKSEGNTKEATIDRTADGQWRLFYEYAADEASRIGLASGPDIAGPWTEAPTPFLPRVDSWDDWHLSTGPLLTDDPARPVMFYNGATRDARWRIGWAAFDAEYTRVVARGLQPLLTPPPADDRGATDIAFAASVVVEDGQIWLYYSLEDRKLARALIRRS
nr:glycosidase [Sphingomonas sp. Y38-1Y]